MFKQRNVMPIITSSIMQKSKNIFDNKNALLHTTYSIAHIFLTAYHKSKKILFMYPKMYCI